MRVHLPSIDPILKRLGPSLEQVFETYELTEEQRRQAIGRAREILLLKWYNLENPDTWFLRCVIDRCREMVGELREKPLEKPPSGASLRKFRR
jgi:hypothetical protein